MQLFLHSSKLLISISLTLCISLSSCGGGGGSTGTGNGSTISSVSIGQENALSSAASVASSVNSQLSSSSKPEGNTEISSSSSHSNSQTVSSVASSAANSIIDTSVHSISEDNSSVSSSNSAISSISLISSTSSSSKPSVVSSSTASTLSLSSSSSSVTSVALSSSSSSVIRSSSKAATSSAYSSSLTQISSSSIASSSSTLSSSSPSPIGTAFHLRGTHNAWVEGDLFTPVVGSTTDLEICRNFLPVVGGQTFKIDPDGGWGNDAFPASSVAASGWTKIVINADIRTIQSVNKDLAENCETPSSSNSSLISSSNSSSSLAQASSSSAASSSLDSFSFPAIYDAPLNTEIISAEIKISGLDGVGFISITGGEFSIDNQKFQKIKSKIYNEQTLIVKIRTAGTGRTPMQALLTLNDVRGIRTANFTVTTMVDLTPSIFSFSPAINSQLNVQNYSNSIIVNGVDGSVPIKISGDKALYSINSQVYSTLPSTIKNGQLVRIMLSSANTLSTTTTATLTIGTLSRTFTVTTVPEDMAPIAQFIFPSLNSLTDKKSVVVRGKASDMSEIISVKVNGIEAITTDNYANWQLNVPLINGENILKISTEDSLKNYSDNVATIKVNSGSSNIQNALNKLNGPMSIALDLAHNRLIVGDDRDSEDHGPTLYLVDLSSGSRTFFNKPDGWNFEASDIAIDEANNRALVVDESKRGVFSVNLTYGIIQGFPARDNPNNLSPRPLNPSSIAIDALRNRAIVTDHGLNALIEFNLTTGERNVFSGTAAPDSINTFNDPYGIAIDEENNRALTFDLKYGPSLVSAELDFGARTVMHVIDPQGTISLTSPTSITLDKKRNRVLISKMDSGNTSSVDLATRISTPIENLQSRKIVIDEEKDIAYAANYWLKSITLVDLITNEQVTISK